MARRTTGSRPYENQRELWDTRWTPNNEELRELIRYAVREVGSIRQLSKAVGLQTPSDHNRQIRRILKGEGKAVSYRVVDQILARSGVSYRIRELEWCTPEELVEKGIWKPQGTFRPDPTDAEEPA